MSTPTILWFLLTGLAEFYVATEPSLGGWLFALAKGIGSMVMGLIVLTGGIRFLISEQSRGTGDVVKGVGTALAGLAVLAIGVGFIVYGP